ncbi:MAG: A24 family peptidase [Planctomycetota bacterium]
MLTFVTLWWLFFWTALGLCVGSFLNAVIYRLPRHGSLRVPRWSACPSCQHRIHWYDNLPLISFVLLRGRCRRCGIPIATRYVVIEAGMAIIVLMLLDAFFIGASRPGHCASLVGLTEELAWDWPMLFSHIALFACLLSMSAIDLEHYWVDIRFTTIATVFGFIMHTLWTPTHSREWGRPFDTTSVVALAALAGVGVTWLLSACRPQVDPEDFPQPIPPDLNSENETPLNNVNDEIRRTHWYEPPSRAFAWISCLVLGLLWCSLFTLEIGHPSLRHAVRALVPLLLFFVLIVRESTVVRTSDYEIVEAIEQERVFARRMAAKEFLILVPALVLAVVAFVVMSGGGDFASKVQSILHAEFPIGRIALFRHWAPLTGFATAASGFIIAGAVGWTVRIVFTIAFGKEAFGTGDIHLLAAAGCVAGWPVAVVGFFLAAMLALIGWLMVLPFKRSRALPLGPWLSVSFLIVVVFHKAIMQSQLVSSLVSSVQFFLQTDASR